MGRGGYSVVEDPLPTGPVFVFFFVCVCPSGCMSVCELICIQPVMKSTANATGKRWSIGQQTTFPALSHRPLRILTVWQRLTGLSVTKKL